MPRRYHVLLYFQTSSLKMSLLSRLELVVENISVNPMAQLCGTCTWWLIADIAPSTTLKVSGKLPDLQGRFNTLGLLMWGKSPQLETSIYTVPTLLLMILIQFPSLTWGLLKNQPALKTSSCLQSDVLRKSGSSFNSWTFHRRCPRSYKYSL